MIDKRVDRKYIGKILCIAQDFYDKTVEENAKKEQLYSMPSKSNFKNYPHLFVFGCVMDSQIDADKAWNIPMIIAEELGDKSINAFLSKNLLWYKKFFSDKKLHRFNYSMAEALYDAIQRIHTDYNDDANNIWNDNPSSALLVFRFLEFKRIGIKIATMAANILCRDYGVALSDKYAIDISPDIHVKRTMYRLCLIPKTERVDFGTIDATKIIYAAKSINPTFPGVLDYVCWYIGKNRICQNEKCCSCKEKKCPFADFCIRQD